jgi:hypothetical protein
MPARLKTRGPIKAHAEVRFNCTMVFIDIGPHDLPLGKRWRPLQPGALEDHHCRATRAVAHHEIRLEIEWFRGGPGPYYRRSWKLIFVGQIRGGVRLGAPMRGDAATPRALCARRLLEVEPYESNVSNWPVSDRRRRRPAPILPKPRSDSPLLSVWNGKSTRIPPCVPAP